MRNILFIITLLATFTATGKVNYEEIFSYLPEDDGIAVLSDDTPVSHPTKEIRYINGGTVFRISYGEDVGYEVRGAFEHACKLLEEYLPPCLPITVRVEWADLRSSSSPKPLSSVKISFHEYFGFGNRAVSHPTALIKRVTLKEYEINSNHTFIDSIPDLLFLDNPQMPDIVIRLNKEIGNDLSYSITEVESDKYDFVSLALRDLIRGLGLVSGYRVIPNATIIIPPSRCLTKYELNYLSDRLNLTDKDQAYKLATTGAFSLGRNSNEEPLNLYAPSVFQNEVSLNYFIPDTTHCISQVLDYNFRRGCMYRDINDEYSTFIFFHLLGWQENFVTGIGGIGSGGSGSTSILVPYNGSYSDNTSYTSVHRSKSNNIHDIAVSLYNDEEGGNPEVYEYCEKFHYFLIPPSENERYGISISLLKKDGTWDIVYYSKSIPSEFYNDMFTLNMTAWTLHCNNDEYARTCDGYLRGRCTYSHSVRPTEIMGSIFFVVDYLPQSVEMKETSMAQSAAQKIAVPQGQRAVRVGMKNLEGLTKVVVERLIEGNRLPSRFEVKDFQKGYFETTVYTDRKTTFTAIGYNANGSTRGIPVTIEATNTATDLSVQLNGNELKITSAHEDRNVNGTYEIIPLMFSGESSVCSGVLEQTDIIDVSTLLPGIYVMKFHGYNGDTFEYKFAKKS